VAEVLDMHYPLAISKSLKLAYRASQTVPLRLGVNEAAVQQILLHAVEESLRETTTGYI
jgi:hypothetical protein